MLGALLDVLRCPLCTEPLELAGASVRCPQRHTFDVARQGYLNLLGGGARAGTADTSEMVWARTEFLARGYFAPVAAALADIADSLGVDGGVVLDAGAGTGYYVGAVLDRLPGARGLALDISKFAARRAARAHRRLAVAVWDVWQHLPVRDESVDLVLNVFAPRNPPEFRRILRPGGALLLVTPQPNHLAELVTATGMLTVDVDKEERLERGLAAHLDLEARHELAFPLMLPPADVGRLIRMGPSAWHVDQAALASHLAELGDPVQVTASVVISHFRTSGK